MEKVDLIEVNSDYSILRLKDVRESSVSNRHVAPIGDRGEIFQEPVDIVQVHELPETLFV